jgi:hypothetical protein
MKRVEDCEIGDMVGPVFDGFVADGGGAVMKSGRDYWVWRFLKDSNGRAYGPFSSVVLRDAVGVEYALDYGRLVVPRGDPQPSIAELAEAPTSSWGSVNQERLADLVRNAKRSGVAVSLPVRTRRDAKFVYRLDEDKVKAGVAVLTTAEACCVEALIQTGKGFSGIDDAALRDALRKIGPKIMRTKQDPWYVFKLHENELIAKDYLTKEEA